jgi:hypothetical protein
MGSEDVGVFELGNRGSDWGCDSMIRMCKPFVNESLFVKGYQRAAARKNETVAI